MIGLGYILFPYTYVTVRQFLWCTVLENALCKLCVDLIKVTDLFELNAISIEFILRFSIECFADAVTNFNIAVQQKRELWLCLKIKYILYVFKCFTSSINTYYLLTHRGFKVVKILLKV